MNLRKKLSQHKVCRSNK